MGQAIVYCSRCNTRLLETDFEKNQAAFVGNIPYCSRCRPEQLEIVEPAASPAPGRNEGSRPGMVLPRRIDGENRSGAGLWLLAAAAGLVLIGLVAAGVTARRTPPAAPTPPTETPVATPEPSPVPAPPPATPPRPEPVPNVTPDPVADELAKLEEELRRALRKEEFARALQLIDESASRRADASWRDALRSRRDAVENDASYLCAKLEKTAVEAKRRGSQAEVKDIVDRVARWGLARHKESLERTLAGVVADPAPASPPPPPVPAAVAAPAKVAEPALPPAAPARKPWETSVALAGARDYAAAAGELERALAASKEPAVRSELDGDLQILKQVAAMNSDTIALLSKWPRDQKLAVDCLDSEGNPRRIEGPVLRADGYRVEIAAGEGPVVVPFGEILPASWAELFRNRKLRKPGDTRAAALFCLLEGDVEAARKTRVEPPIPEKYWELGAARPAPSPREAEARKLFVEADRDADAFPTAAAGARKFASLLRDFAETALVRRNHAYVTFRAQAGKEYFLSPESLAATGAWRWSRTARREAFWTATADADPARRKENYIEIEISVHEEVEYKVWAFIGGCCVDTMAFQVQTGEQIGGEGGTPVKHAVSATKHASHKGTREPTTWGWVAVSTLKAPATGPQRLRLLAERQGFSAAVVWVTALNRPPPRDSEFKELEQSRSAVPGDRMSGRDPRHEPGLIGYWRFDDGAGGAAADASKSANSGRVAGATWVPGAIKGALSFDGKDDYVATARPPAATDTFTMAFWASPAAERKSTPETAEGISGTQEQRYAIFPVLSVGAGAGVSVGTNGISVFEHSGSYLPSPLVHDAPVSGWTHVTVVYANRKPRLYVNGLFVKEGVQSSRAVVPGSVFGSGNESYGPYKGLLDEIRIYDRALTEAEISMIAAKPRPIGR